MRDRNVMVNASDQEYDSLDRVIRTLLPAAPMASRPEQITRYEMRSSYLWAVTKDPLGNVSEQASDGRGNITQVRRLDRLLSELTSAGYSYNGLGELLLARDADGNLLEMEYDRLGQRVKMSSADMGTKQWWYDASGNLASETDSELSKQGKRIHYQYDGLNRLVKIDYPYSEPTIYEYGDYRPGGRDDNAAGRITRLTDETGTISYVYGRLGQVEEESRFPSPAAVRKRRL